MEKVFEIRSAKEIVHKEETDGTPVVHLFGDFFLKNEICALFGDSNSGKSILCNDIAISIGGGGSLDWPNAMSDETLPSLYFDFEMSGMQYGKRFLGASSIIPPNMERVELNQTALKTGEELLDAMINYVIAAQTRETPPKLIIIDNLTYLMDNSTNQRQAIKIMKGLKKIKSTYDLSIVLVAHCPKRRKDKPITQDDLGGSKMVINFCDSAMAIGTSVWDDDTRYIKHIKARGVEKMTKVVTVEISPKPYLHMKYVSENSEETHLGISISKSSLTPDLEAEITEMRNDDMSIREIADELGLSKSVVGRFVKERYL